MAGEHKLKPLPYAYNALKGITEEVVRWHHDTHQAGYVNKRNEIEKKLESVDRAAANANFSEYRELKREETFNASGMILHEIYWDVMGGDGTVDENLPVVQKIKQDFGSVEKWKEDFLAAAKASRGWAILCWDPSDGKLHNYICDWHHDGAVWGAVPLLPIDVWEHAYYRMHGPNRATYIDDYLKNLKWSAIDQRYERFVPAEFRK